MGGSQGRGFGDLAQRANPQMSDPMQNINNQGLPRGRNIMGGSGQSGAPGPGMPQPKPGMIPGQGLPGAGLAQPGPKPMPGGPIGPPPGGPMRTMPQPAGPPPGGPDLGRMMGAMAGGMQPGPGGVRQLPGQGAPPGGGPFAALYERMSQGGQIAPPGAPPGGGGMDIAGMLAQAQGPGGRGPITTGAPPGGPQLPPQLRAAFGGQGPAGPGAGPAGK